MNLQEAVTQVRALEQANEAYEKNVAENLARLKALKETIIPDMLMSQGLKATTLDDGTKIRIDSLIHATATDEAFEWMEANGFADMIKKKLEVDYEHLSKLTLLEIPFSEKKSIHYQTLKAFIREQLEAGNVVPTDAFKLYLGTTAYIKNA